MIERLAQVRRLTYLARPYVLFLAAFLWLGCEAPEPRYPGHLTLRLASNPTTLDPALITDVTGGSIAAKIFNGLVRFGDDLSIAPDIAESWKIATDKRTYTFRIRKDASFSTGRRVTAGDFIYSFERVLDKKTRAPLTWVLDRIEGSRDFIEGKSEHLSGMSAPDDHTLIIRLNRPFAPFLALLGMTTASVVPREEAIRQRDEFGAHPVGTGPYKLREWNQGQDIVLDARQDYFEGSPRLSGIRYRIIPEDLTAVVEFETGRLDIFTIPASEFRRYTTEKKWKGLVQGKPGLNCYYLGLNCSRPPFNDLRLRQAVSLAIDRKRIFETVYEGRGTLATGPVPPQLRARPASNSAGSYPYAPEHARKIIEASGWKGKTVTILISAEPEILDLVEVIQQYLNKAGLTAKIIQLDWSAFKQAVNRGEGEAYWLSWWADYPDPENFLYPLFHSSNIGPGGNRSRYTDPDFDRMIEEAQTTLDKNLRSAIYEKAEQRIIDRAPWVFLWNRSDFAVVQPWIAGYVIPPLYSVDKGLKVTKFTEKAGQRFVTHSRHELTSSPGRSSRE